jgi:hypothetical protein
MTRKTVICNHPGRLSLLGAVGLLLLAGCRTPGRVQLTALDFRNIDPPRAAFQEIKLDRCYWWTDDAGQVWIAMTRDKPWLLGAEYFRFRLSLVLERLPRGKARNYLVSKRELRGVARFGPAEARLVSKGGVVALYREGEDRLRGSFRLQVRHQSPALLGVGGWTKPRQFLVLGTFDAVRHEERGRQIADETESQGWDRPPPATQPVRPTER